MTATSVTSAGHAAHAACLDRIDAQRAVIDARLTRPARWRGVICRELHGAPDPGARGRVAATFDRLVAGDAFTADLDVAFLAMLHRGIGGNGRLRRTAVCVGDPARAALPCAPVGAVGHATEAALDRAAAARDPAPVVAARLDLDLLVAHPFDDGNGRVARLAAACVLLRAGFRSTLLTAVEQHTADPLGWHAACERLQRTGDVDEWTAWALAAMAARSAAAAAFRSRELRLRDALAAAGFEGRAQSLALASWDMGKPCAANAATALDVIDAPWYTRPEGRDGRAAVYAQLRRLRAEEADERRDAVRARSAVPPPTTGTPVATVIVPAYRAARTIAACLRALQGQDLTNPFEVVVVASGGDATADIVRHAFRNVRLVEVAGRLTPGAARNLGIARARGAVVAFLAADCLPASDWLRRRVEAHRAGNDLVGGYLDSATPSTPAGWAQYFSKFWGVVALEGRRGAGRGPLFHLSYRAEILRAHGPFDETTIAGEDTAYNRDLVLAGHRVWFDAAIRAEHVNDRRFRDVVAAQREQGAAIGALCRTQTISDLYAPSVRGGPLGPVATTARAAWVVACHRPRLLPRLAATTPLIVWAIAARRRAFRRTRRGATSVPAVDGGALVHDGIAGVGPAPLVSVVVAAYDEARVIGACLDSLLAQSHDRLEVIVVDDGSRDRTVEIATSRGVPVVCLPHGGPAVARNTGARLARGRVVVFVDADLVLDRDCVEQLAEPILARRATGTFTTDIGVANAGRRWSDCWSLRRGVPAGTYMPPGLPERWANFRAVDRAAFVAAGGYDDIGYGEDMTLATKIGTLATRVPGATMWHHNPDTLREAWENAVWFGKGARVQETAHAVRRHAPLPSLRRGFAVARRAHQPRYVLFNLVFDTGVLAGLALARVAPERHWK